MENEHTNSTNKIHPEQIHTTKQILYKYIELISLIYQKKYII